MSNNGVKRSPTQPSNSTHEVGDYVERVQVVDDEGSIWDPGDGIAVVSSPQTVTSAAPVQVASSATVVTLKASNTSRRGLLIFNDSTSAVFVKYGATATSSDFTVKIAAAGYFEMPAPIYTGQVTGIWASANGNAYVTELAP
jgi:hypothetical protein